MVISRGNTVIDWNSDKETQYGKRQHARSAEGRCSLRSSDLLMEPEMAPFISGARNKIHIIDLELTVPALKKAAAIVRRGMAQNKNKVLFVGTKRAAAKIVKEQVERRDSHSLIIAGYGMLTNWKTIRQSIKRLRELEAKMGDGTLEKISEERSTRSTLAGEAGSFDWWYQRHGWSSRCGFRCRRQPRENCDSGSEQT